MSRVAAMIKRDWEIFRSTHWKIVEFLYFPISSLLIWGFFALWASELAGPVGHIVLAVNILWSWAYVIQSSVNMSINEDMWSGSGVELLATGMSKWEYVGARVLFSSAISAVNLAIIVVLAQLFGFFDFMLYPGPAALLFVFTFIISMSLSLFVSGLLFILGKEHNWISWSALQFFVLLSSPFSPVAIMPGWAQIMASVMPYTALFQAVRELVAGQAWLFLLGPISAVTVAYVIIGIAVYWAGFERARKTGQLLRSL